MTRIAVVRVRGSARLPAKLKDTLRMLHLLKVNHCAVVDDTPHYNGMLQHVKDRVTWGEIGDEEMLKLLEKRGRVTGDRKLTEEYIKKNTKFVSIAKFTEKFMKGEAKLKDIPGLKPYFRLNPPRGGYENIKKQYANKGTLGKRGAAMGALLERMLR
jgi:large subunit ribosomal protein L30